MAVARAAIVYPLNGKYVVIGGNGRVKAQKQLGKKEIPVITLPVDTPVEKIRHVLYRAEDLERIPDASKWEEVRNNASIAAMQGLMAQSWQIEPKEMADIAVKYADALVSRLKQIDKVPNRDDK